MDESDSSLKTVGLSLLLVFLLLVFWYVLVYNANAKKQLSDWGIGKYVPAFPCPQFAFDKGWCE
jgi:hypothetical protein